MLDQIKHPSDVKKLSKAEIRQLALEIRTFLVESVSRTGGHLASNLGVVELTLALHYVYSLPEDKIIWDVGHQSYVHKLLTGRKAEFEHLRQWGGMAGFPKTSESKYDSFNTGHSSTSISAAYGLAAARDLKGESSKVIAVIGDGSMTGGMAYEALNNVGATNTDMLVILNDNSMSISKNVGGVSQYLNRLTNREGYYKLKTGIDKALHKIPLIGEPLFRGLRKMKNKLNYMLVPGVVFQELGFHYYGPVNGHDFQKLVTVLEHIKGKQEPALLHIYTKKGKGYTFAENSPGRFHGISSFDPLTGEGKRKGTDFSSVFGETLCDLAEKNNKICAITAAMPEGTGLQKFSKQFPERFFDVGIAEQHAVTFGAGLAMGGYIPVFAVYSSFLQRGYDQIVHDVAIQNLPVVFGIDRAGVVGEDGETHQGMLDLAFLTQIPNLTVLAPADFSELRRMLSFAVNLGGPVAVRYPRGGEYHSYEDKTPVTLGKGRILKEGNEVALFAIGRMVGIAYETAELLEQRGISTSVIDLRFAKPLDESLILNQVNHVKLAVVLEDGCITGGVCEHVASLLYGAGVQTPMLSKAFPDAFIPHGSVDAIFEHYGMNSAAIAESVTEALKE
ncbi:MAG: 1-deoxy-D-xylulose-5-phosphate synthase [Ruminococcaceae bacterium]|nr:1-deoxy-D-xylulose-5-phosphate synthase [Oscillospiraceae bacterium]